LEVLELSPGDYSEPVGVGEFPRVAGVLYDFVQQALEHDVVLRGGEQLTLRNYIRDQSGLPITPPLSAHLHLGQLSLRVILIKITIIIIVIVVIVILLGESRIIISLVL